MAAGSGFPQLIVPAIDIDGRKCQQGGGEPRDGGGSWFSQPVLPAINIDGRKCQRGRKEARESHMMAAESCFSHLLHLVNLENRLPTPALSGK